MNPWKIFVEMSGGCYFGIPGVKPGRSPGGILKIISWKVSGGVHKKIPGNNLWGITIENVLKESLKKSLNKSPDKFIKTSMVESEKKKPWRYF